MKLKIFNDSSKNHGMYWNTIIIIHSIKEYRRQLSKVSMNYYLKLILSERGEIELVIESDTLS